MPRPSSPLQARSCKSGDWISSLGFWRFVQCPKKPLISCKLYPGDPSMWGSTLLTQIIFPCYFLFIQTGCILSSQKAAVKRSQLCFGHISSFHVDQLYMSSNIVSSQPVQMSTVGAVIKLGGTMPSLSPGVEIMQLYYWHNFCRTFNHFVLSTFEYLSSWWSPNPHV